MKTTDFNQSKVNQKVMNFAFLQWRAPVKLNYGYLINVQIREFT